MGRYIFLVIGLVSLFFRCNSIKFIASPLSEPLFFVEKKSPLNKKEKEKWHLLDLELDTIPGMSVERAYKELIKKEKGSPIIVGVIDSGVDIHHPVLKNKVWVNEDEIPNNGIDDDLNGYVDDVHGWNFLGNCEEENMEYVRLQKKEPIDSEKYMFYEKKRQNAIKDKKRELFLVNDLLTRAYKTDSLIKKVLEKKTYSFKDVENFSPKSFKLIDALLFQRSLYEGGLTLEKLKTIKKTLLISINKHYSLDFNPRKVIGDNPDDLEDIDYGDSNVIGPKLEKTEHGTHVSGIIASNHNYEQNHYPINENLKIMILRAVPDGDEYDKDVALAIRYAVANGAKIINTSFGKEYSPHKEWVWDALKYAEEKDVLIISAAGNGSYNIDPGKTETYITDFDNGEEIVSNFLSVGASTYDYDKNQLASFSNFGKENVDIFAPGDKIWSCTPGEKFDFLSGTSMAAPNASFVAAILRSIFPKLSARETKLILMKSGIPIYYDILIPDSSRHSDPIELSKSGKLINLYNALIMGSKKKINYEL